MTMTTTRSGTTSTVTTMTMMVVLLVAAVTTTTTTMAFAPSVPFHGRLAAMGIVKEQQLPSTTQDSFRLVKNVPNTICPITTTTSLCALGGDGKEEKGDKEEKEGDKTDGDREGRSNDNDDDDDEEDDDDDDDDDYLEEDDGEIDLDSKDWRAFRAQLVMQNERSESASAANTVESQFRLEVERDLDGIGDLFEEAQQQPFRMTPLDPSQWAYDSGTAIEKGTVILGGVEQEYGFGLRQQVSVHNNGMGRDMRQESPRLLGQVHYKLSTPVHLFSPLFTLCTCPLPSLPLLSPSSTFTRLSCW